MSEYSSLIFDIRANVAHITLNRPDAANALNAEMARELMEAALRCDEDPAVRAVLISGAGKIFCSGGDIKGFAAQPPDQLPAYLKTLTSYLHLAVSRFTRMRAPVIAAVHGSAAGGGFSLAISADLLIAAESARFTMAYTRIGVTPDGSSTYFLPRIVGMRRALELALTNRVLTAIEAREMGIVTRVVPDTQLMAQAEALATEIATGATVALGATKRLLHEGALGTLETQMELEARSIADMGRTADGREGIASFLAKRAPKFSGK